MVVEFHVQVDKESGTFEPATMHVRMEHHRSDGTEVAVEMELESIVMDRDGLITLTQKESDSAEPVLVFEVRLTDELLSSSDFETKIADPIEVTFTARPKPETPETPPPEPLERKTEVVIDSPGDIHWTVADDPTTRDVAVDLDADGQAEFVLSVRYEVWDPEKKRVDYDPADVEFTHWTGPGLPPEVFGPAKGDEPWNVAGPTNNRDHSRWASKMELPNPARPEVKVPLESYIRVRVWPKGTIERHPGSISFKEGAKLLAEKEVPLTLREAKQVVELIEPTEPVPADGQDHDLVLRFLRERDRKPVEKGTYSFEFEPGEHHRGGKLAEPQAELAEEANGELRLRYEAPDLTYEPEKSFTERLQVYRGVGDDRQLLDTLDVHLSPKVELRIEAEKTGLTFEPFEMVIEPGQAPASIRGVLTFDVVDKVGGDTRPYQVAHADVLFFTGPGAATKVQAEIVTDRDGKWEWKLPELAKGLEKLPLERREKSLDPETERPECRFDDDAEAVIRFYEDKVWQYTPWHLYDSLPEQRLRQQRLVFGEHLAQNPEHLLERAVSGTNLLRTGATFGHTYQSIYDSQMQVAANGLSGIFMELIGWALNAAKVGDKVGAVAGRAAQWVDEVGGSVARRLGTWCTTEFATVLKSTAMQIIETLQRFSDDTIAPTIRNMIEGTIGAWVTIRETAENLIRRQGSALAELVTGAIDLMVNVCKAIGNLAVTIVMVVLSAAGAILAILIDALGSLLQRCAGEPVERFIATVGHYLTGTTPAMAERGKWGIGKAFEELYKAVLDKLAATQRAAGATAARVDNIVYPMVWVTEEAMTWLNDEVEELRVPEDGEPRIDAFRDTTLSVSSVQAATGRYMSLLEIALAMIDMVVLIGEVVLMLAGMFLSVGFLNPVTLGPALTAFEISFAKVKLAFVRLPALAVNLVGCVTVAGIYGLEVWNLPGPVTAPNMTPEAATP